MKALPPEEKRKVAADVARLIELADAHEDFLLAALLCTVLEHLEREAALSPP